MINNDIIFETFSYLSYDEYKYFGLLNGSLHSYSQRDNYKKLLLKKYIENIKSDDWKICKSFLYHTNKENIIVVKELIDQIPEIRIWIIKNSFEIAFKNRDRQIIDLLIQRFIKNSNFLCLVNECFVRACEEGDLYLVKRMINHPIDVNGSTGCKTPLEIACQMGHIKIVNRLLSDPRVDPSIHHSACLRQALPNHKIVKRLMKDPRVNPNDKYYYQGLSSVDLAKDYSTKRIINSLLKR